MQPLRHDAIHGFSSHITQRTWDISIIEWESDDITINLDVCLVFLGACKMCISEFSIIYVPRLPMLCHILSSDDFLNSLKII